MPDTAPTWISCRAYAKRRSERYGYTVTPMAVSVAISSGRLVKSVIRVSATGQPDPTGQPKISDPDLADREWDANTDPTRARQPLPLVVEPAPTVLVSPPRAPPAYFAPDDHGPPPTIDRPPPAEPEDTSIANAAQREKHWRANLAELKFKAAARELVPAADVERRLVDVFSACKTRLLAIPSRARQALPHLVNADVVAIEDLIREALEDLAEAKL